MANEEVKVSTGKGADTAPVVDQSGNTVYTYPDGSQRVGKPPFPKESPKEEAAKLQDAVDGSGQLMHARIGQPHAGTPVGEVEWGGGGVDNLKAKADEQLTADVLSGKNPDTINPTTASDKPGLANTGNVVTGHDLETINPMPTGKDLEKIADKAEVKGNMDATEEQEGAAASQIAREQRGALPIKTGKK